MLSEILYEAPPEADLFGLVKVVKYPVRVPHDLETRPEVVAPEVVDDEVEVGEVPGTVLGGCLDEVKEPVDADLNTENWPLRQILN